MPMTPERASEIADLVAEARMEAIKDGLRALGPLRDAALPGNLRWSYQADLATSVLGVAAVDAIPDVLALVDAYEALVADRDLWRLVAQKLAERAFTAGSELADRLHDEFADSGEAS